MPVKFRGKMNRKGRKLLKLAAKLEPLRIQAGQPTPQEHQDAVMRERDALSKPSGFWPRGMMRKG